MSTAATSPSPADTRYCLAWAIKDSLIAYVQRTPDGVVAVGPGVALNAEGEFLFPYDPGRSGPGDSPPTAFRGEVAFTAHGGLLQLLFADPRIEADGTLSVRTTGQDQPETRVRLATLGPAGHREPVDGSVPCALTAEGARLFHEMYGDGSAMAPVAAHLPPDRRLVRTAAPRVSTTHRHRGDDHP